MIEIRIPTGAAVFLLKEKISLEIEYLQRSNIVAEGTQIEDLSDEELLRVTEAAVTDLVFSLPAEIFSSDSNIVDIIYKAVKSFAAGQKTKAFNNFSKEKAANLINSIKKLFIAYGEKEVYSQN
jgi:hypothetical protein